MVAYRRIYENTVKRFATKNNIVGVSFIFIMFMMLLGRGDIVITGFSGDQLCAGTIDDPCYAYINFTAQKTIYIYPTNESTWMFNVTPDNMMKDIVMQRSWGNSWRTIDLSKPWSTKVKYALKLNATKDYQFRFIGYKNNINSTVKWGFGFANGNTSENTESYVDPEWTGYKYSDFFTNLTYNTIEGNKGIAIFEVSNPLKVPIILPIQAWSKQFDKVNGDVISSKIELVTDTDEVIIKEVPNKVCVDSTETICSIDNQTMTNTCVDFTTPICEIQGTKFVEVTEPKGTVKPLRQVKIDPNETMTFKLVADLAWSAQINIDWYVFIKVLGTNFKSEDWAWWNTSYASLRQIEVNTTEDVADYQLKLFLDDNTNYQADWEDIRFTGVYANCSEDTSQLRPYWVEDKVDSTNITVWVKANLYTACNESTQLYNYYNNADVTNVSDIDTTMVFGEDCDSTTVNTAKWSITGTAEQSGGNCIIKDPNYAWAGYSTNNTFARPFIIETKVNTILADSWNMLISYGSGITGNPHTAYGSYALDNYVNYNFGTNTNVKGRGSVAGIYRIDVLTQGINSYYNDVYDVQETVSTNDNSIVSIFQSTTLDKSFGWTFIRKYTASEPTYSIGAEEGQVVVVTLNSPANETTTTDTTPDFNFTVTGSEDDYECELFVGGVGYGIEWRSDSAMVSGLVDVGTYSAPTVFYKDDTWYLISGERYGTFDGFNWTGSTWQSDTSIVSNLNDVGDYSTPTVFYKDTTWYLIASKSTGTFDGFNWTGSTWQTDTEIASGLGDVGSYSSQTVFEKESTWYLISGEFNGVFYGFNWTGSMWQSDNVIISGLSDVGGISKPTAFEKDSIWYLISGENDGVFNGYTWTGITWQIDTSIISNLGDVGGYSSPDVFYKDSIWYLVSGDSLGTFTGFNWTTTFNNIATIITPTLSDGIYDWNVNCTGDFITNSSEIRSIEIIDVDSLTHCTTLDIANTVYTLGSNVTSTGTCFTIGANNITIDGAGYTINHSTLSAGSGIYNGLGYDNMNIYNLNIIKDSAVSAPISSYGIKIWYAGYYSYDNNINNVNISSNRGGMWIERTYDSNFSNMYINTTGDAMYLAILSSNNLFTNLSVAPQSAYSIDIDNSLINLFVANNFSTDRIIGFREAGQIFKYNDNESGSVFMTTTTSKSQSITRSIDKWINTWVRFIDTSEGYIHYNITGLLSNQIYSFYNRTIFGTTYSQKTTDGGGYLNFSIYNSGETIVSISQFLGNYIYLDGETTPQYYEIGDYINITANSINTTDIICLSLEHPDYGYYFSCYSGVNSSTYIVSIIPAKAFLDNVTNVTSYDSRNVTFNAKNMILSAYLNIAATDNTKDITIDTGNDGIDVYILGDINGSIANISTFTGNVNEINETYIGASQSIFYVTIPRGATVTSAVVNLSSTGAAITQNKVDGSGTYAEMKIYGSDEFYIEVPRYSTIDSIKVNVTSQPHTFTLGEPDTITCTGDSVTNCAYSYGTDADAAGSSKVGTAGDSTLNGYGEWDIYNITNISAIYYTCGSLSGSGLRDNSVIRYLYIYNYLTSGYGTEFRYDSSHRLSETWSACFGGSYPATNPNSGRQKLKIWVSSIASTGGSSSNAYSSIYYSHSTATRNEANATFNMVDLETQNVPISATVTELEFNVTHAQYYVDNTCDEDPCKITFVLTSIHEGTEEKKYNVTGVELVFTNNPLNVSIDSGNDKTIDWEYLGDLNTTTSPQQADLNVTALNTYLSSCGGLTCDVPFMVYTKQGGDITFNTLEVLYSFNPININSSGIDNYLIGKTGDISVPIYINATFGNVSIYDVNISYYGDVNYTIVSSVISNTTESIITNQINLIWSNYSKTYPSGTSYFIFKPKSVNSTEVSPVGQKDTVPFYNITGQQQNMPFDVYVRVNDSLIPGLNFSVGNSSNYTLSTFMNTTYQKLISNISEYESAGLWFWQDLYNVNTTLYRVVKNYIETKTMCVECVL